MDNTNSDITRRRFLQSMAAGATVATAGCSGGDTDKDNTETQTDNPANTEEPTETTEEEEQETEEEPVDRPDNYRWDMKPGRNEELRNNLGQYVEGNVGAVVENHPSFEYSTDSERDDHTVDFEALKLFRDSQFDILKQNNPSTPWEHYVEAFVNDDIEQEAKKDGFMRYDVDDPHTYTSDAWLNADSFEQSLDMAHGLLASMVPLKEAGIAEQGAILREAFQRNQDYEAPLAWETNMGFQTGYDDKITGLMYTPEDDKMRAFDWAAGDRVRTEESRRWHSEIQEWPIFNEDNDTFHPLLFHTDERNRQNPGFANAKSLAFDAIHSIAADGNRYVQNHEGTFAATTGFTKLLTRTLLEYNENDASFEDIWQVANATEYAESKDGHYIFDTGKSEDDYSGVFNGDFAIYEVEDESILEEVRQDQSGDYDNFGQVYDKLEHPA